MKTETGEVKLLPEPSNKKLGFGIRSFSIPTLTFCPGKTAVCAAGCYAERGRMVFSRMRARLATLATMTLSPRFASNVVREITETGIGVVRVHVAGDFYSAEYVDKWTAIAVKQPRTIFFAYTRSWRDPAILPSLKKFAKVKNVRLWWSEDVETGPSPPTAGVRVAFTVFKLGEEIHVPDHADLVFRDRSVIKAAGGVVKRVNGVLVCPHEQSKPDPERRPPPTCTECRICFSKQLYNRRE
jgi:hypothetical protein